MPHRQAPTLPPPQSADIAIVGAGAAGLMAGIWAGRSSPNRQIVLLDGARTLGAKILIAGGGRCNVTHDVITVDAYAGATRPSIRKVLRRFDAPPTVAFFQELGVTLKREEGGKLFPTTDRARTVLDALLAAATAVGLTIVHPYRVTAVMQTADGFQLAGDWGALAARRVVLATGGRSLPKSGSDGAGYQLARVLGHSLTPRIFPALVPLTLPPGHFLTALSGITVPATLELWSGSGRRLQTISGSLLCTHFGLSGPVVLDMSRYLIDAQLDDPAAQLTANWLPDKRPEQVDAALQALAGMTALGFLRGRLPERLARALCIEADVSPAQTGHTLTRVARRRLVQALTRLPLPISGNRGYNYAEVTAGGVPLSEIQLRTMESRVCPGLYLCGEICDVDGRIGGYNFQWAWSSGYVAGISI